VAAAGSDLVRSAEGRTSVASPGGPPLARRAGHPGWGRRGQVNGVPWLSRPVSRPSTGSWACAPGPSWSGGGQANL